MITPEQLSNPEVEDAEQSALFAWAAINRDKYQMLKWLHAIPNNNKHRQVATGVRGGVPDILLPWPSRRLDYQGFPEDFKYGYHGLYIEMKIEKRRNHKNGGCSDEQLKWIEYLLSVGYQCHVCYGWQEARDRILEYLS